MKSLTAYNKPGKCPHCGSGKIENIIYTSRSLKSSEFNKSDVIQGENCEARKHPRWQCKSCKAKIFLRTSRRCRSDRQNKP